MAAFVLPLQVLRAEEVKSYAMTQVSKQPGGGQEAVTRWFVTPMKSRVELAPTGSASVVRIVVITRRDKGLAWTLFPPEKAYIERPLEEGDLRELGKRVVERLSVESLGRGQLWGFGCDKQRVSGKAGRDSNKVRDVQTVWRCDGFDVPLRIDGEDGSRTRTTELEVGPQPDHLFEVPTGYSRREGLRDLVGERRAP